MSETQKYYVDPDVMTYHPTIINQNEVVMATDYYYVLGEYQKARDTLRKVLRETEAGLLTAETYNAARSVVGMAPL